MSDRPKETHFAIALGNFGMLGFMLQPNLRARSIGKIVESLVLIYEVYTPEEMVGRVEYL